MFCDSSEAATVFAILRAIAAGPPQAVVLIDGPSGSGKSSLADTLFAQWPTDATPQLVRLDDVYPGWGGLVAGAEQLRTELLLARAEGRTAGWRAWDWSTNSAAQWHPVFHKQPLIVEGCGAFIHGAAELADVTVWVSADDAVRKSRALARDAGGFDAHWNHWQKQWERYVREQQPREQAQFVLDVA